jgi:ribonuclease-3
MQLSREREQELQGLEKKLSISFLNKWWLNQALTHSSYGHEQNCPDNERLEFLGDAVLKLVISEYLYHKFPERAEGELTKIRAGVISDETLSSISKDLGLGEYLLLSANEKRSGGQRKKSNLANAFEALLGAIYLDAGLGKVREFILENFQAPLEKFSRVGYISDFKSALQEYVQKHKWEIPQYRVIKETGPKHRRLFWMEVKVKGKRYGIGRGRSKKEAEQRAAAMALRKLKREEKEMLVRETHPRGLKALLSQVRRRMRLP